MYRRREVYTDGGECAQMEGGVCRRREVCTEGGRCVQKEGGVYRRREGYTDVGRCVQTEGGVYRWILWQAGIETGTQTNTVSYRKTNKKRDGWVSGNRTEWQTARYIYGHTENPHPDLPLH